jgi:N-acetylmuramoyl-L-alanine amidase
MTIDSDAKRAILRGVYEDNVGLPRTFSGKRQPPNVPGRPRRRLRKPQKIAVAGLLALILSMGFTYRSVFVETAELAAVEVAASAGVEEVPDHSTSGPMLRSAHEEPVTPALYPTYPTSNEYDAMLSRLDLPVADLFDLAVRTIVIDPGHGGSDPGAIGRHGLMEKDVTLDIARRLRDRLEAAGGYRVLLTRDNDRKLRLKDRVAFATEHQADLFISVHINAVPEEAGPVNYVETYYFGPHADQQTLDLAEKENRDSDYGIGDFRGIISRIGDRLKTEESAQLAAAIHKNLYANLQRYGTGLLDAGVKSGPFVVLLGVEAASVLVEISCISNEAEATLLATPEYRDSIAKYLEMGVVEYLGRRGLH